MQSKQKTSISVAFIFTATLIFSASFSALFADLDDDIHKPIAKPSVSPLVPQSQPYLKENEKTEENNSRNISNDKKRGSKTEQKKAGATKSKQESSHDQKQPIKWNAKGMQGDRKSREVDLLEEVVITQGNLKLESNKAKVIFTEKDEVEKVIASGNVRVTKDSEDETQKMSARGREAIFDNSQRTVTMIGDARLFRGADLVRGKQIVYNLDSGMIRVEGVEGVVQQNSKSVDKKTEGEAAIKQSK